jgi:AmmeMemoRadiSam system protein B
MRLKRRYLPEGWYPSSESRTRKKIEDFLRELGPVEEAEERVAGILPHAGWDFSGKLALDVARRMGSSHTCVAVVGGHLGSHEGIYASFEEAFETPLGVLQGNLALLRAVEETVPLIEDTLADNTVEVQLPFIKYLYPESTVVCFRAAPSEEAHKLGRVLWKAAEALGERVVLLGSTDLTHYGDSYGFAPRGYGNEAVTWVKDVNDRRFLDALLSMEWERAVDLALRERSACSAGAAVTAVSFASAGGVERGTLLNYMTSWDVLPSSSFVGYAGILY